MDEQPLAGRYRRVRSLGWGASGEVWLAEDLVLHRQVAVKHVRPSVQPDAQDLERMMREARLTARLNHPNAVSVFDLVVENGLPNVVMEYVTGQTLADRIAANGGLPPDEVAAIGAAVADALAEAHAMGIIHRDIKPANILLTGRGTPKLADFGIARIADESGGTITGQFIGTPAYVAPEVAHGARASDRSDVWSLGITLWAALQGRPPAQHAEDDGVITVLSRVLEGRVDPPPNGGRYSQAVMRLLDADPHSRPTAAAAAVLLRHPGDEPHDERPTREVAPIYESPRTERWEPPTQPDPLGASRFQGAAATTTLEEPRVAVKPERGRRRAAVLLAALALVALAVAGGLLWLGRSSKDTADPGPTSPRPSGSASGSAATQTFTAPGGISVTGPAGWTAVAGDQGNSRFVDLLRPGTDKDHATFLRIGISNVHAPDTIQLEAASTRKYIATAGVMTDVRFVGPTNYVRFLDHDAAQLEYTGTNSTGLRRHVIERLWIFDDQTHILFLSAPDTAWERDRPLFDRMIATCEVT